MLLTAKSVKLSLRLTMLNRKSAADPISSGPAGVPGALGPLPVRVGQGVGSKTAALKMSELPKVAGQSACGAGAGSGVLVWSDNR
jgi:hypothetical protein